MEIVICIFAGIMALVLMRWFRRPIKRTAYVADFHLTSFFTPGMVESTKRVNEEWANLQKDYPNFLTPQEVFDRMTKRNHTEVNNGNSQNNH